MSRSFGGSTARDDLERRVSELESGGGGGQGATGPVGPTGPAGTDGDDGNGISSTTYDAATGQLTLSFTDSTSVTTGDLRGQDGQPGSYSATDRLNASFIGGGNVSNAEFDCLNGVTSSINTQLDNRITQPTLINNPNPGGLAAAHDRQVLYHTGSTWDTKAGLPMTSRYLGRGAFDANGNLYSEDLVPISLTLATGEGHWPVFLNRDSKISVSGTVTEIGSNLVPTRSGATANDVLTFVNGGVSWQPPPSGGGGSGGGAAITVIFAGNSASPGTYSYGSRTSDGTISFYLTDLQTDIININNGGSNVNMFSAGSAQTPAKFTAPASGIYSLQSDVSVCLEPLAGTTWTGQAGCSISAYTVQMLMTRGSATPVVIRSSSFQHRLHQGNWLADVKEMETSLHRIIDLQANDEVSIYVNVDVVGTSSTNGCRVMEKSGTQRNSFQGHSLF